MPIVTPFQYVPVLVQQDTTAVDPSWDVLLSIPVSVLHAGAILVDFRATVQCQYQTPDTTFLGAAFQLLWDGSPLPEVAYVEFDPAFGPPNVDTFAGAATLRALISALVIGPHTLELRWQTLAPNQLATIFPNLANLTIQGAPA